MPKSNPRVGTVKRTTSTPTLPTPSGSAGGGEGESNEKESLLISLTQLNTEALAGLAPGNPVSLRSEPSGLCAYTSMGSYVGKVPPADAASLSGKRIRRATIHSVQRSPALCIVEVVYS